MSEKLKHVADVVVATGGGFATLNHWLVEIINPLLTTMVSLITIVWLYYRVMELRNKRKKKAEE